MWDHGQEMASCLATDFIGENSRPICSLSASIGGLGFFGGETGGNLGREGTEANRFGVRFASIRFALRWHSLGVDGFFLWRQLKREICRGVPVGGRPKVRNRGGWVDVGKTKGVARSGAEREDGKGGQNRPRGRRREAPRWRVHSCAIHLATLT